jgi:hypothetical protein
LKKGRCRDAIYRVLYHRYILFFNQNWNPIQARRDKSRLYNHLFPNEKLLDNNTIGF